MQQILNDDVYTILKILANIISSDFADYFDNQGSSSSAAAGGSMQVIDVVLYGLSMIIPLISQSMMKVCIQFFLTHSYGYDNHIIILIKSFLIFAAST
jgi:hypothetical protein